MILLFGLNDSAVDVWRNATEPRVPMETYRKNLTTMVRTLKADGVKPILVTPQPMHWTEKLKDLYAGPPHHDKSPYDAADPLGFNATLVDYVQSSAKWPSWKRSRIVLWRKKRWMLEGE